SVVTHRGSSGLSLYTAGKGEGSFHCYLHVTQTEPAQINGNLGKVNDHFGVIIVRWTDWHILQVNSSIFSPILSTSNCFAYTEAYMKAILTLVLISLGVVASATGLFGKARASDAIIDGRILPRSVVDVKSGVHGVVEEVFVKPG